MCETGMGQPVAELLVSLMTVVVMMMIIIMMMVKTTTREGILLYDNTHVGTCVCISGSFFTGP